MKRYLLSIILLLVVSFVGLFPRQSVTLNIKNSIGIGASSKNVYFKGFSASGRALKFAYSADTDDFYRIPGGKIIKTSCIPGKNYSLRIKTSKGLYNVSLKINKFNLEDIVNDPNCSIHLKKRDLLNKKAIEGFKCVVGDIKKID